MKFANGSSFAGYTIVRQLGSGRTGAVYLAEDPRLARQVALKVLNADVSADADFRAQFGRDIDIAATLDHPNIAAVLDHGEVDGQLWIASEFVDGIDVGRLVRQRFPTGMTATAVATIVHGAARALDYAHGRQLVHRHVNPSNILIVDPFSDSYRIVLTDFGTSRLRQKVSPRTDQFGLAATATYLLTGRPPSAYTESPLSASHPELAPLDPVFARAFAKDSAARFTSCRQFATALAQASAADPSTAADGLPQAPEKDTAKPRSQVSRVMPLALAVLAVALLAATVVLVVMPRLSGSSTPPSGEASPNPSAPPSAPPPNAPLPCGKAVVDTLSTRDKLAQLLMVGVTGAADARAVVADQHVGGIMIGSWTDLSMLQDGSLRRDRRFVRSAAAGRQRRRRGRPGTTPVEHHRLAAAPANACRHCLAGRGVRHRPRARPRDERPWNHSRFRAGGRRHRCAGRHRHRRPVVRLEPGNRDHLRRRIREGAARRRPAAGAQAFPRARPRLGRFAHRRGEHTRRSTNCRRTT